MLSFTIQCQDQRTWIINHAKTPLFVTSILVKWSESAF